MTTSVASVMTTSVAWVMTTSVALVMTTSAASVMTTSASPSSRSGRVWFAGRPTRSSPGRRSLTRSRAATALSWGSTRPAHEQRLVDIPRPCRH